MSTHQLTEKEANLFVLTLVKECLVYAENNNKTFEEVLNEDVFPNQADTEFAELVCNTINTLSESGYITGNIELAYEMEYSLDDDEDDFSEESTDAIDFSQCTFENIAITAKGNSLLSPTGFKESTKEFGSKVKSFIKCIATTALQTAVELAVTAGLKAVGFPV